MTDNRNPGASGICTSFDRTRPCMASGPLKGTLRKAVFAAVAVLAMHAAHAAEIKVFAANAVKEPFLELAAAFERATGHKVTASWSGTAGVVKKVADGEAVDLVIVGSDSIDKLIRDGKLVNGSRADFAKSGIGVAVRPGTPKPDLSSEEGVKKAVLAARSVAYSSGPSGVYIAELFKRMGISDQVKDKLVLPPSNVLIGDLLARGEVDLGFQQVSDLVHVKGIDYVGPLPASIQNITVYSIALHPAAPAGDAARALVKFLTGPVVGKSGMEPG